MASTAETPNVSYLVLDAAPLLALSPLRGLAQNYVTVPQVISELRDKRAREHFEQLGLTAGVNVQVRNPDVVALAKVTAFAKKTGDYAVLSRPDMLILALTYSLHEEERRKQAAAAQDSETVSAAVATELAESTLPETPEFMALPVEVDDDSSSSGSSQSDDESDEEGDDLPVEGEASSSALDAPPLDDLSKLSLQDTPTKLTPDSNQDDDTLPAPVFEDPLSEDDGEGEWITPDNVAAKKAKEIFPSASSRNKGKGKDEGPLSVACMTADYAMQNVLLQMGLNLVGVEGKRITTVKSWVLRCHACFKLCKDQSKKFCPSCGNATLIRASVSTVAAPPGSGQEAIVQVHLKKNFQYRNRGTKYSIPAPKAGSAKRPTSNLILREDQAEFQRGMKNEEVRVRKEERKMNSALAAAAAKGDGQLSGKSWADPDWMPDMLLGMSGRRGAGLPDIGYGSRNPNRVRKGKK